MRFLGRLFVGYAATSVGAGALMVAAIGAWTHHGLGMMSALAVAAACLAAIRAVRPWVPFDRHRPRKAIDGSN